MHFDQNLIFIIVAAVIGISRLVARIADKAREQKKREAVRGEVQQRQSAPEGSATAAVQTARDNDNERIHKFLEALGQPAGTTPPPPVQPRSDVPPRPLAPVSPPPVFPQVRPIVRPVIEKAREVLAKPAARRQPPVAEKSKDEPGEWLREEKQTETAAPTFRPAISTRPRAATRPETPGAVEPLWKRALRSPDAVRSAFILREVLGPPRAFSEIETATFAP
ncbi:MAG: hypothetical protein JO354_04715 [Verrucomicrobia bacterium]|nr:hypothetical protein [Verrucomicrobiota bacterium]